MSHDSFLIHFTFSLLFPLLTLKKCWGFFFGFVFQERWQTRALSDLPLRLPEIFTDGPKGTEKHLDPPPSESVLQTCFWLFSFSDSSQESWASDLSRVREFLMGYMRGVPQPEPMLQLDEVTKSTISTNNETNKLLTFLDLHPDFFFPLCFPVLDLPVL